MENKQKQGEMFQDIANKAKNDLVTKLREKHKSVFPVTESRELGRKLQFRQDLEKMKSEEQKKQNRKKLCEQNPNLENLEKALK